MRHALIGVASCALALSLVTTPVNAADTKVKYRATRAIVVDRASGQFRKPNAAELAKLVTDLKSLTKQPTAAVAPASLKNGGTVVMLDGSPGGVMLARPNPDGTYEMRCVFTFEEAAAFLGLVADNSN